MNDTTTITHSSGKPVPQAPPFLLHFCRFFNEVCEGVATIGAAVAVLFGIGGSLILGLTYAVGWIVLHVFSDPLKEGSGFDAVMNTGVGVFALIVMVAVPIAGLCLAASVLRDLWKKTGRSQ